MAPSAVPSRTSSLAAWIQEHAAVPATVAMISRVRWITVVTAWAATPDGRKALAHHLLRPQRFLAIATAMAQHCNGSTGRNIAVPNRRLASEAGCSPRLVTTTRRILIEAGWLYKSAEGVSSRTGRHNRPSIVHLTTPRPTPATLPPKTRQGQGLPHPVTVTADLNSSCAGEPVDNPDDGGRVCDPLRSTHLQHIPPGTYVVNKPKARPNALRKSKPSKTLQQRRRWWLAYRIADELITQTVGLKGARGPVAAALAFSDLDLEAWTTAKLKAALDFWGNKHRIDWPLAMRRPGAFLASRLQHLATRPEPSVTPEAVVSPPRPITGAGRTQAWAAVNEHLTDLARTRADRRRNQKIQQCPVCATASIDPRLCPACHPVISPARPRHRLAAVRSA
jgi:hypothetical protein